MRDDAMGVEVVDEARVRGEEVRLVLRLEAQQGPER
jgi:hypothetical protein